MKRFALALCTLLFAAGTIWAQCDHCGSACNSGCQCGCNDPGASPSEGGGPPYDALNVDFKSVLTLAQMGATGTGIRGNDCWGWTHTPSGREFAIFGMTNQTSFVEITDPLNPVYLGKLPTAHGEASWRDIKVFNNRAYIVADGSANGSHGVQVFELSRLLAVASPPETFTHDARFTGLGRSHNIAINESTGYAYAVGSPSQFSSGGLIMLNLNNGVLPQFAGVFSADGYTHDCQVVTYHGPDNRATANMRVLVRSYIGREIAFNCNEDTLTIVDVTVKGRPQMISRTPYAQSRYTHQGWLSEDHKYFFVDDELDEQQLGPFPTRTHVWDVRDLDNPVYIGFVNSGQSTIDHNLYVLGNYIYQANYSSGLRIKRIIDPLTLNLPEVGYFDTYSADNNISFNGAWSCYPYFPSGNIIVSDRQNGLFVVKFNPPAEAQGGVAGDEPKEEKGAEAATFGLVRQKSGE